MQQPLEAFVLAGLLGSLSTVSSFALQTWLRWQEGRRGLALAYVGLSALGCLVSVFAGHHMVHS